MLFLLVSISLGFVEIDLQLVILSSFLPRPIDLELIDSFRPDSIARSTGSLGSARNRSFVGVQGSDETLQIRAIQDPIASIGL
jgi:hypothetical protein